MNNHARADAQQKAATVRGRTKHTARYGRAHLALHYAPYVLARPNAEVLMSAGAEFLQEWPSISRRQPHDPSISACHANVLRSKAQQRQAREETAAGTWPVRLSAADHTCCQHGSAICEAAKYSTGRDRLPEKKCFL